MKILILNLIILRLKLMLIKFLNNLKYGIKVTIKINMKFLKIGLSLENIIIISWKVIGLYLYFRDNCCFETIYDKD